MLENMGYWQNGLEIEKKGMLPYGNAALIRVNFPSPRDGRRTSSSAFLILPIVSYDTIFAAKWSSNGELEAVISKSLAYF